MRGTSKLGYQQMRKLPRDNHFRRCMKMFHEAGGIAVYDFTEYIVDAPDINHFQTTTRLDYVGYKEALGKACDEADKKRMKALRKQLDEMRQLTK